LIFAYTSNLTAVWNKLPLLVYVKFNIIVRKPIFVSGGAL